MAGPWFRGSGMVGVHRCGRGHSWTPGEHVGVAEDVCPVCGVAREVEESASESTPRPFVVGRSMFASDNDQLTSPHLTPPSADDPSFSSLAAIASPVLNDDQLAVTRDAYEVESHSAPRGEFVRPDVPGYDILEEVGRGGMGVVYKARQISLNRPVALKMILSGSHAGPTERERFRREAEAVAQLQNPHIVQIFEIGEASGHPYLALEFVDGGSLAQQLTGTPWPAKEAAALVELLARAVHYAHEQGVVHRDLKPGNVLLSTERGTRGAEPAALVDFPSRTAPGSFPKVTDFGLAKRIDSAITDAGTKTGAVMGTPSYIAPEQAAGKTRDVGPAVDVYSLGAILYELLTGRPPFRGESPLDTVLQVIHDEPVSPKRLVSGVPRDLETICLTCLAKNPEKRYASAAALGEDLRRFSKNEPIQARPLSAWGRTLRWSRRHPALTVLGVTTALATLGIVAVLSVAYARVAEAVRLKEQEADSAQLARDKEEAARERAEQLAADYLNAKNQSDALAAEIRLAKNESDAQAERTRRVAFALQLTQISALCERDPRRALQLLDDEARCPPELRDFTWAYLRRLCHREQRIYAEQSRTDALFALAVAPNGGLVATAGHDGLIRLWDPRTGRTWAVLHGHQERVLGLAFSPDSGLLASVGADRTVRLWEIPANVLETARRAVNTFTFLQPILRPATLYAAATVSDAHEGEVTCVAIAPDGRTVLTGGLDGTVKGWDLSGWRVSESDSAVAGGPAAVAIFLLAQRLKPVASPLAARVEIGAHQGGVLSISFASNGLAFATGGEDGAARVWSASDWQMLAEVPNHTEAVQAVALSPDAKLLASVNNATTPVVRVTRLETRIIERRLTGHTAAIHTLAFSPDGLQLASGGFDRTVRLWGIVDDDESGVLQGHEQPVTALAFSPDNLAVLSASADTTARVWLASARPFESTVLTPEAELTSAAFGGVGSPLVATDEFGKVHLLFSELSLRGGKNPQPGGAWTPWSVPLAGDVTATNRTTAVTPDGSLVIAAGSEGLAIWRVHNLRSRFPTPNGTMPLPVFRPFIEQTKLPIYAMTASPDGKELATLDAEGVRLWNLQAVPYVHDRPSMNLPSKLLLRADDARDVVFLPGGRLAVAIGKGLWIIDASGKVLGDIEEAHPGRIDALAYDASKKQLASASKDGLIRVWTLDDIGELELQAELMGHADGVDTLSFSPDGRTLASGGRDRTVRLWGPATGQERASLTGHADRVLRVQFTADGLNLMSIDRGGSARRWRAEPPVTASGALKPPPPPRRFGK